MKVTR